MGLDANGLKFLIEARRAGVDFSRTATMGRQEMLASPEDIAVAGVDLTDVCDYAEEFLKKLGANEVTSFDASAYEGASVVHDFNRPIGDEYKNRFTCVLDGGTLEHIFDFPTAIRNCMEMVEVGGHFLALTPANNYFGHGFYQFSPELFYRIFSEENGFAVEQMFLYEDRPGSDWYEVADPAKVGERVTMTNSEPASLAIIARKVSDAEILARSPQQSDYATAWNAEGHKTKCNDARASFAFRVWKRIEREINRRFRIVGSQRHFRRKK